MGLLRHYDIKDVTIKVKYTEKEVSAYTQAELRSLLGVPAHPKTGLVYGSWAWVASGSVCWEDLNFESKTYTVQTWSWGSSQKTRGAERAIARFSRERTEQRRLAHPDTKLIFPNKRGGPEGHFLRRLQATAKIAGLPGVYGLHKFRKSFASWHHEAGVSARTLQRWLGHSSLETTLQYLEAADIRSERTREQVNNSFAILRPEPATAGALNLRTQTISGSESSGHGLQRGALRRRRGHPHSAS